MEHNVYSLGDYKHETYSETLNFTRLLECKTGNKIIESRHELEQNEKQLSFFNYKTDTDALLK